ncbi:hypothetical protein SAMD00019534_070610 [Acytostelium subglobosum LB1]|uniref:hypothetical protein n=1 Tax=Acytostelium subglobosum LB1 TaxID=1410327 RepID=UPI000644B88D|nr:hypothetical protein SAMD00019534_070610 [Acytostelium subglobosum LB1]GAM23886.1 hypothetical protein SAMD00019534_070610 [Acytostelium subglobosum LB1]|eukprot:XP_012752922.1 hypothetical protein SAMD00019534_070610 [Acytostelium subglobosum LB1]
MDGGVVDSAFVVFAPVELFNLNTLMVTDQVQVFDPVKYTTLGGSASIEQEYFGPGSAALLLNAAEESATYTLTPGGWPAGKKIKYFLRVLVQAATATTIFMRTSDKPTVTIPVPVPANTSVLSNIGANLCNFEVSDSKAVTITIGTKGTIPVYVRSIMIVKDKDVAAA